MLTRNEIFTNVATAIQTYDANIYTTSVYEPNAAQFPTVFVREIGSVRTQKNITLAFDDEQRRSTWEVQIFVNKTDGAMTAAHAIADVVEAAFSGMYFILDMREPIDNMIDRTIYRLTMRFHRQLANDPTDGQ